MVAIVESLGGADGDGEYRGRLEGCEDRLEGQIATAQFDSSISLSGKRRIKKMVGEEKAK